MSGVRVRAAFERNFRGEEKEEREGGTAEAEPAGAVTGGGRAGAGAARLAAV